VQPLFLRSFGLTAESQRWEILADPGQSLIADLLFVRKSAASLGLPGGGRGIELVVLHGRQRVGEAPTVVGEEGAQGPATALVRFPARFLL